MKSQALTAALWDCAAYGAMTHSGRHLTERQLEHLVQFVLDLPDHGLAPAAELLHDHLRDLGVELQGEIPGTFIHGHAARIARLQRFVKAVRDGL